MDVWSVGCSEIAKARDAPHAMREPSEPLCYCRLQFLGPGERIPLPLPPEMLLLSEWHRSSSLRYGSGTARLPTRQPQKSSVSSDESDSIPQSSRHLLTTRRKGTRGSSELRVLGGDGCDRDVLDETHARRSSSIRLSCAATLCRAGVAPARGAAQGSCQDRS